MTQPAFTPENSPAGQPAGIASAQTLLGVLTISGLVLLLLCGLLGYHALERLSANERAMQRSEEVTRALDNLVATVRDAETGQRGYLLTQRSEYLTPYISGERNIGPALQRVRAALASSESTVPGAAEAERAAEAKIAELETSIALYRTRGRDAALALVLTDRGRREMEALRYSVDTAEAAEAQVIEARTSESARSRRVAVLTFTFSLATCCLLLAAIYIAVSRDLVRRERVERSLRNAEEQERLTAAELRILSDRIPALLSYVSTDGRFIRANETYGRWLKVSPEEIIGKRVGDVLSDRVGPGYWAELVPYFERACRGESVVAEATGRYADGVERSVEIKYEPYRGTDGTVLGVVVLVNDVTARRRTEEGQARLASLVQSSSDAIVLKTPQGIISAWNRGAERIYGWSEAEAIGKPIYLIVPPELHRQEEDILQRLRRGERLEQFETVRVRKDGSRVDMSLTISPVFDNAGRIIGVSKIGHEITARKRAEAAIQQLNAELETRVRERTRELEEANEDLQAFSYSVSHDLRAPLRAVQGFADALLEEYGSRLDETGRSYLRQVEQGGARMTRLIDDLLAYSRLGRLAFEPRAVPLGDAVNEAVSLLGGMSCDLEMNVSAEFAVLAHGPTLEQAIANLLSNACKFVRPGVAPRIRVWAEPHGKCIRLWVEDNGIGIAPEHRDGIFRVFERLHGQEAYPGTGIGLAIVRRAAERMHGAAGVESELGRGSRFWLELPRAEQPARLRTLSRAEA